MATLAKNQEKFRTRFLRIADLHQGLLNDRKRYLLFKRIFDLAICIGGLPILLILAFLISIAIVIDSPGSPIFIQERIGKDGKPFQFYKFRTLRDDYDNPDHRIFMQAFVIGQPLFNANNPGDASFKPPLKPHITRIGKILRKTSLDEILQIINVLKGEMSLIGPRPNVTWEAEKYLDWHKERLKVLPGITGLAQVHGRSCINFETIVRYDIEYIEKQSMKLDLQILWWTLLAIGGGNGAG